jgi:hypothetical protein
MTDTTKTAPEIWHAIEGGLTLAALSNAPERAAFGTGRVLAVGDEIRPADYVEATRNRYGYSPFEHLSDDEQIENWGRVHLRAGTLDSDPNLVAQLEAAAAAEAAELERERRLLAHRYPGKIVSAL